MRKKLLLLCFLVFGLTQAQTYVDVDATGNNNGTSWTDAYNSLDDALNNTTTAGAEIWIAEGTYKPSSASTPFINRYGLNIYGGFVGTEASKADRNVDPWLHPVYLSGDINGDDLNEVPSATSTNKSDNANRILQIEPTTNGNTLVYVQQNITIDRINFINAYGGSALYSHPSNINYTQDRITLLNCRFTQNYAASRPAFDVWSNEIGGSNQAPLKTFSLLNSIVDENVSQIGYAFEYRGLNGHHVIYIANNLFIANKVENAGKSGSVARFISNGANSVSVYFNNNTLSLNEEGASVSPSVASCIRFERTSVSVLGGAWYNNIYYNNPGTNKFAGFTSSGVGINSSNTNARDFTPANDLTNSINLASSPFIDIFSGNFEPLPAFRQNGTMGGSGGYNLSDFPATDCFQNSRTYSNGTIIGLGAIQHANSAMFHGPGDIASLSTPTPMANIFVDAAATGNNDGSSWADAYNSLYDALNSSNLISGGKVFVKAGTYYPTSGGFAVNNHSIKIIGGFDGTETDENDRDMSLIYTTNATIISGDVNDDDIAGDFTSNKSDNLAQLMFVNTNGVIIDGLIFENAYKTSSSNPVIYFPTAHNTSYFTLKNSIIRNNYVNSGMLMDYRHFSDTIEFINVAIKGNKVSSGFCLFQSSATNTPIDFKFVNFEFSDNEYNSDFGAIWFRETGTSNMNTTIVNSTFVNNKNFNVTVPHLVNISSLGSLENVVDVYNCIFHENLYNTNTTSNIVFGNSKTAEGNNGNLDIYKSIVPTIYPYDANIDADTFNVSTTNPNLDSEYKPTSASNTVIDQGTNSFYDIALFGSIDASGNTRIMNSTIELGAYEYAQPLSIDNFETENNKLLIYPNPATDFLNIMTNQTIENIAVYSVRGQKVLNIANQSQVDISNLPSGMYFLSIKTNQSTEKVKIIKK